MPATNVLTWRSLTPLSSIGVAISTSRKCPVQGRRYDDIFHSEVPARRGERAESELGRQTTGETQDLIKIFALKLIDRELKLSSSISVSFLELLSDAPSNQHFCRDHRPQVHHLPLGADQVRTSFTRIPPDEGRKHHAERSACDVTPSHHLAAQWRWLWEDSPCGTSCSLAEERPAWSVTSTAKRPKDYGRWAR